MARSFLPALTLTAALIAALMKGSAGDPCNDRCGHGTRCKHYGGFFSDLYYACDCGEGLAYFCHDLSPWQWTQCGPHRQCYWHPWKRRYLCVCRHRPRDTLTGEYPPEKSTSVRDQLTTQTESTVINTDTATLNDTTEASDHGINSKGPVPSITLTSVEGKIDPNIGDKSSPLTTGLAVGISGVVLLGLALLAIILVKKKRQRTKSNRESAQRRSPMTTGSGDGSGYVNVIDITPQQGGHGANNFTYPASTLLPDLLSSSAQFQSGGIVLSEDNKGDHEKIDLPPHPGMIRATLGRYSLAGAFNDQQTSEEPQINELYSNHHIVKNKWNKSTGEKFSIHETAMNDIVYNVLTRPNANLSSATARDIPGHYNTLSDVKAESTSESQVHVQPGEPETGN